jgi:hypothetical protein
MTFAGLNGWILISFQPTAMLAVLNACFLALAKFAIQTHLGVEFPTAC